MSDLKQINTALERIFQEEGARIVFWNDPEQEFQNALPFVLLDGVSMVRLDEAGALEVKIRLERVDPVGKFLIYSPAEEPDYEDDWLLDIRLYSRSFRADRASILLQELGLVNQHLRSHIAQRRKFFDSKDRLGKIKPMVGADDTATDLDRKMISVVTKSDQPELFNILRTIFHAWTEAGADLDLDIPPAVWAQVEKFELDVSFWSMVKSSFGYSEENPTLKKFLLRLFATDFAHYLKCDITQSLEGLLLPRSCWSNVAVCLAQWRDSSSKGASYDRLSAYAATILKIEDHLPKYEIDQLSEVMTFLAVEKRIASGLRERVQTTADSLNADEVELIANRRQSGHWASVSVADTPDAPRRALHAVYDSLVCASQFYALRNTYKSGFSYESASLMYKAYETELYRFDQLYRHFCESADVAEAAGWNILKPLRVDIEAHYNNWYVSSLALEWGKFIEPADGLLSKWQIDHIPNQYDFFDRHVKLWLGARDNRHAYVIISDAFRYEAAQELTTELNGKYRFEATLTSQLGVLPSYTALGMASLLPHKTMEYKGTDVLVDGKSSVAGERGNILQSVNGLACKSEEIIAKKKEDGREFVKDRNVVYIYHNTVDSIGDDSKTEEKTFEAVRKAIDELAALVVYIVNNLNGHHILITADHGFMFSETPRVETDKSKLEHKPVNTLLDKKRYLIGPKLPECENAWHGKVSATSGVIDGMEFWIPKGANVFHFVGGARFVHGGAMPQEVVVPIVTVKHVRGKGAQETKTKPVTVQVLGMNHRITTGQHRFQLIQTEAVSDRLKPITLRVAVYDGEEAVTDIQTVKFESSSGNLDERKKWVSLALKDRQYNKKTPCRLVLRDADTGIEQQSVEVIIDKAFSNDF